MLAFLLAILPQPQVAVDQVDYLERNFYWDDNGNLVFVQVIGWENSRVRFWTLEKEARVRQDVTGGWIFLFDDGVKLREIWSLSFFETHCQYDPELLDREVLPKEQRRPLSRMLSR